MILALLLASIEGHHRKQYDNANGKHTYPRFPFVNAKKVLEGTKGLIKTAIKNNPEGEKIEKYLNHTRKQLARHAGKAIQNVGKAVSPLISNLDPEELNKTVELLNGRYNIRTSANINENDKNLTSVGLQIKGKFYQGKIKINVGDNPKIDVKLKNAVHIPKSEPRPKLEHVSELNNTNSQRGHELGNKNITEMNISIPEKGKDVDTKQEEKRTKVDLVI